MAKIAGQTIIGQNNEPFLEYALRSVDWLDYFTVVNTDPYGDIGKKNEKVVTSIVPKEKLRITHLAPDTEGHFSFAEARNLSLDMIEDEDYVFILDADDVHYPEWEDECRELIEQDVDYIQAHFYHIVCYKNIYQFVAPRDVIYRKYSFTHWTQGVHEQLVTNRQWPVASGYHYMHYGYLKPQAEVYNRWRFYSDLEGDFNIYKGQNPDTIIEDRISVAKVLNVEHPSVIQRYLRKFPDCPREKLNDNFERMPAEKAGLCLITYNDAENLNKMLPSLAKTIAWPDFEIKAIDLGSDDGSQDILMSWQDRINIDLVEAAKEDGSLMSLTETLNHAFNTFRQRHDIQYIGWIHPDMVFDDARWLTQLAKTLTEYKKVGKVCAWNTRDGTPPNKGPFKAHEQCYIIRKDIVNKIGLFDEGYIGIGGYEDWDYNRRIMNHDGYKVVIDPKARVYHEGMATRARRDTTAEQVANRDYYVKKWNTDEAPV